MMASQQMLRGNVRDNRGFTLIELMITMLLLVVVLGATLALLDGTNTQAARDTERSNAVMELGTGISRMTNEIRHAVEVRGANAYQIDFLVRCRTTDTACLTPTAPFTSGQKRLRGPGKRVVYRCDAAFTGRSNRSDAATVYRTCVRTAELALSAGACCAAPVPGVSATVPTNPPGPVCGDVAITADECSIVVLRVKNWNSTAYPTERVFTYRFSNDTTTSSPTQAQLDAGDIESIDVRLRVPSAGERRRGLRHDLLFTDGGYFRNIDLF